uniref:Calcium-transporting ATPase n=1 Tax=Arcella intermedia TaxID=1963864 RepID=A0A6B2KX24_9EUKA
MSVDELTDLLEAAEMRNLESRRGVEGLAEDLKSDLKNGLNDEDHTSRILAYGKNQYPEAPHDSWFALFLEAFQDLAVIILSVAAVVSLAAGITATFLQQGHGHDNAWIEGVAILCAVLIVAVVSATNNYSKEKQFRDLKEKNMDREVRVRRNGEDQVVSVLDIMVGDICLLHTGNKIPADGIFIPSFEELMVDESSLTGESENQIKNATNPFLFAECNVVRGSGKMLVTGVGCNSKWGRAFALLPDERPPTPLQDKLEDLVVLIGKVGLAVSGLVFVILIIYYLLDEPWKTTTIVPCSSNRSISEYNCSQGTPVPGNPDQITIPSGFDPLSLLEILGAFIISVTIVVVAVPEGLPLAVTISLAYSMSQMMKDQNLVRHLSACETMGGATNICSDKTGTLTENRMAVVQGVLGTTPFGSVSELRLPDPVKNLLILSCCLNNEDGSLEKLPGRPTRFLGSVTECALLVFSEKLGVSYKQIQDRFTPIKKWGFTSARKRMSTVIQLEDRCRLFSKGAAEILLQRCSYVLNADGTVEEMSKKVNKKYSKAIEKLATQGLRTICLAFRDFHEVPNWASNDDGKGFEEELICIGIVGIEDPLRPEVPDSVRLCKSAGITVRMVTGDNPLTATKIARDCGILTNGRVVEGPEFSKMTDQEIEAILPTLQVLARSSPADKFRLVNRLKDVGEVVAVTGDGTNDGPALSAADVGLAMGIAGTEVAKQAADIIILDDNFASIVKSVMWGRCVYDNIRKFLQFQLTVNVVALIVAFVGAVSDYGTPLTAVQLLWVNLIMDSMAALALGTEKPTYDLLKRKPYGRSGKLITLIMWRNILGHALFQVGILFSVLFAVDSNGNHLMFPGVKNGRDANELGESSVHYTMVFNTFVFMQVFNEINARKVNTHLNVFEGILTNPIYCGIILITAVVQALIVQFGGGAIKTLPLDWIQWFYCVGISYMALPYGFLLRLIPVPLEDWEIEYDFDKV